MRRAILYATLAAICVGADEVIYADKSLSASWQDQSWGSTIVYNATDIKEGSTSISVNSAANAGLSFHGTSIISNFAGLSFDLAGKNPILSVTIEDVADPTNSASIPLSLFNLKIKPRDFTTFHLNFASLPPDGVPLGKGSWNRITWQAGKSGARYHIDNIRLISGSTASPVPTTRFLSAEPLASNIVAVTTEGAIDLSQIQITLNGQNITINSHQTVVPVDAPSKSITYLTLGSAFSRGNLVIVAGSVTFNYALPASMSGTINQVINHPISPRIYGVNFPPNASYINNLGIKISRWGGNTATPYNPFGDFTNAGNDWFFENRANKNADDWIGWVTAAGSDTLLAIPALDWVAKDAKSYSYPKHMYPVQQKFDSNGVSGNGRLLNGSYTGPPPNPTNAYVPWNTSIAHQWLSGLKNKPTIVTIDNELEITSNTHQDMHPQAIGYDEELARVVNFSTIAKAALPDVLVAAPSTNGWWHYWRSAIGWSDTAAHNSMDFIPWFLTQMQKHEQVSGTRLLDYLDLHYYFAAQISNNNDAAKALRLTRSWWDPTYVDESWIGTSKPVSSQPNATVVQLIPRMQALIAKYYPGTKLAVSEWTSPNGTDITGGLVAADSLGIFGRYQLDSATYWSRPIETGPIALAFWLYRGYGTYFGNSSASVNIPSLNPNTLGVYAGTNGGNNVSLVIVNKDPNNPVALNLSGIPNGMYFLRHFGGKAGIAKYQTTISVVSTSYIVVPSYTAVFLQELTPASTSTRSLHRKADHRRRWASGF